MIYAKVCLGLLGSMAFVVLGGWLWLLWMDWAYEKECDKYGHTDPLNPFWYSVSLVGSLVLFVLTVLAAVAPWALLFP